MNEALKTYSVPMIIALAVLATVQLVKSDKIPINIPPRVRPWVAIGLAVVAAIATRVIQGADVGAAVLEGIGAGLTSIGLFEAGSSVRPGGAPPPAPPSDRDAPTDPPAAPPPDLPSGSLRWALAMTFALLAFGCSATATVNRAVDVANAASAVETAAAPFLDEMCVEPLRELATREPSPERARAVAAILDRCDAAELSYDVVRQLVLRLRALVVAATSDSGARLGDILDAIEQLTRASVELADQIDTMRRAPR